MESHDFLGDIDRCHKCGKIRSETADGTGLGSDCAGRNRALRVAEQFDYIRARRDAIAKDEAVRLGMISAPPVLHWRQALDEAFLAATPARRPGDEGQP